MREHACRIDCSFAVANSWLTDDADANDIRSDCRRLTDGSRDRSNMVQNVYLAHTTIPISLSRLGFPMWKDQSCKDRKAPRGTYLLFLADR